VSVNTTPDNLWEGTCGATTAHPLHAGHKHFHDLTSMESNKVKLNAAGNLISLEVFEDGDNKKYLKQLMTLQHLQATKGVAEKLLLATKELREKNKILKTIRKSGTGC
jgi:hypothetical protein